MPRSAPALRRREQEPLEGIRVFDRQRRQRLALLEDRPEQQTLCLFAIRPMRGGLAGAVRVMLGPEPGGDRLVVVLGLEQALMQGRPKATAAAVKFGGNEKLLE